VVVPVPGVAYHAVTGPLCDRDRKFLPRTIRLKHPPDFGSAPQAYHVGCMQE